MRVVAAHSTPFTGPAALASLCSRIIAHSEEDPAELRRHFAPLQLATTRQLREVLGDVPPLVARLEHPVIRIAPDDFAVCHDGERITVLARLSLIADGSDAGFYMHSFYRAANGDVHDYLDYAMVKPGISAGASILDLMAALAKATGSRESGLKTAWIGRYYWACQGYDFANAREREVVTNKARAFVHGLDIRESQLSVDGRPFSWSIPVHARDLAKLQSNTGPVTVPGLVGYGARVTLEAQVGKAFMLGDWELDSRFLRNWNATRPWPTTDTAEAERTHLSAPASGTPTAAASTGNPISTRNVAPTSSARADST